MAVPKKGEGWGLVKRCKSRVGLLGSSTGGGKGSGGIQGLVVFRKSRFGGQVVG